MRMQAILRNKTGALVLVEPRANLKQNPPAIVWNPDRPEKGHIYLGNYQAVQKWSQWWKHDAVIDVPDEIARNPND